jgi:hypothetical protein
MGLRARLFIEHRRYSMDEKRRRLWKKSNLPGELSSQPRERR